MIDPVRHRQLRETEAVAVCTEIFTDARNELYLNMRFLDISLSSLGYEADYEGDCFSCDGFVIYYQPQRLMNLYQGGRFLVNRAYLHMVYHCLFCHLDNRGTRDSAYWNLACDIAMESVIDSLYKKCVYMRLTTYRREIYSKLRQECRVLNAESVYEALVGMELTQDQFQKMASEFYVDDHSRWEETSPGALAARQNKWGENREKMQTEMETFGEKEADESGPLLDQVRVENRERYDYKRFLRKFSVIREEIGVDPDSFDYVFYTYGLSLYGNMPLVEPVESREVSRIEDFVIAVDTSMSCSGELVLRFLEETYGVLCESETYFKKVNIHIIQCDDQIRSDQLITSREEMERYMENFTAAGGGGTDFRPVFEHVGQMVREGKFHKLKGLLYFTDGKGIYPVRMPAYDTAFVFVEDQYEDLSVPPWAMKLILTSRDLMEPPAPDRKDTEFTGGN